MSVTNASGVYYDPYDVDDRHRSVSRLSSAAGGGAALLQRAVRLLRRQPGRRRGAGPHRQRDLQLRPRRRSSTSSARTSRCRPACSSSRTRRPHTAPESAVPQCSRRGGSRTWSRRSARSAPGAWTRSSARDGSTSSPTSARRCRCGPSACSRHPRIRPGGRSAIDRPGPCAPSPANRCRSRRSAVAEMYADYIDWRAEHPSDDLMTELLNVEFEDETGTVRSPDA